MASRRGRGRRDRAVAAMVVALLGVGCSVSTPRGGVAVADAPRAVGPAAGSMAGEPDATGSSDPLPTASESAASGPSAAPDGAARAADLSMAAPVGPASPTNVAADMHGGDAPGPDGPASPPSGAVDAPADDSPKPGVADGQIAVSIIAGFSGVLSPVVENAYQALLTWQDDVNETGGINGRQVVLKRVDHQETAAGGVAACKQALSNGTFVAMVPEGIEANVTAVNCLDAAGMPSLYFAGTRDPAWKVAFSDVITSDQGGTILGSYVQNAIGAAGRTVGVIHVNQLAYQATADAFVVEAGRLGLDLGPVLSVEPNQATFTSELVQMQRAGVEVLVISATAEAIGILRDAKALDYRPTITGWGFTLDFVTTAGRDLFAGVTGIRTSAAVDAPAYAGYEERMRARGRSRARSADTEGFLAYGHALLLGELLARAGDQPTWNSFVVGAETLASYDNGILPPISYGPGDHVGADAGFAAACCNGDWTWQGQGPAKARF